jgi:uncharacterized protein (DUF2267 family)
MAKTSVLAREELLGRVQVALHLPTRGDAQHLTNLVIACVEDTLLAHLADDGFAMKLKQFRQVRGSPSPSGLEESRVQWRSGANEAEGQSEIRQPRTSAPVRGRGGSP